MKKTVITYGLIMGAVSVAMMFLNMSFLDEIGFDGGMVVGYTTMVLAGLLIYFGVRSYRDNVAGGTVSFGRALTVGVLIMLISAVCYVASWELMKDRFAPDFNAKYEAHVVEKAKASGKPQAEIDREIAEARKYSEMYKNPVWNAAFTFLEPLPVGVLMALISAAVLKRKPRETV